MHVILLGTSSVGKSSISRYFKEIGYTHISCDDYIDKISKHVEKKYYSEYEEDMRDRNEPMYERGIQEQNPYILYDDITMNMCNLYEERNIPNTLYKILLYPSIKRIVDNIYKRRFTEKRGWTIFIQYPTFYTIAKDDDKVIDIINKDELTQLLKDKLKFLFTSEQDLIHSVNDFFLSLGASENDTSLSLTIRKEIQPNIFIKIQDQTPYEIFQHIHSLIHPVKFMHERILVTGPVCVGKTLICNELTKIGYTHVDYKYYEKRMGQQFDTNRYYSKEERELYDITLSMYNIKADKIVYEDCGLNMLNVYNEKNDKRLVTIFVHLDIEQIVKNMSLQSYTHVRYPEFLYKLAKFYRVVEKDETNQYTLLIQYNLLKQLLLQHIQFLFYSEEYLDSILTKLFNKLQINEIDKDEYYTLGLIRISQYDLIMDMRTKSASDVISLLHTI
jgi:broad-specificity NMP kinase